MKSQIAGTGKNCPKCRKLMVRCEHKPGWKPKPNQPYYFLYWDYCKKCRHLQHYEAAKVYVGEPSIPKPYKEPWRPNRDPLIDEYKAILGPRMEKPH